LEKGQPLWTSEVNQDRPEKGRASETRCLLCLPMTNLKGEPIGVVTASRLESNQGFSEDDMALASTFCTRAAVALERVLLSEGRKSRPSDAGFLQDREAA